MKLVSKLIIMVIVLITMSHSAPVITWIPPYAVDVSFNNLKADYGVSDGLTHLALQFWKPSGGSVVKDLYGVSDTKIREIRDYAQAQGIKVMLCVWNGDDGWHWNEAVASFQNNKTAFINALVTEMERLNLDGIEVDLEGPQEQDYAQGAAFVSFIRDLSSAVHAKGKELTVASFASQWHIPGTHQWSELLPLVDGLTSMGYEEMGRSAPGDLSYARQKQLASAAPGKLMLGMPDHVQEWQGNTISQQVSWVEADGTVGLALWDLQMRASGWRSAAVWQKIKTIKGSSGGSTGGPGIDTTNPSSDLISWTGWNTSVDNYGTRVTSSSPIVRGGEAHAAFSIAATNSAGNEWSWATLSAELPFGASNNLSGVDYIKVTYSSDNTFKLTLPQPPLNNTGESYFYELPATGGTSSTIVIPIAEFEQPSWATPAAFDLSVITSLSFGIDGVDGYTSSGEITVEELVLYNYQGTESGTLPTYFSVDASAGSGGSISPAGTQQVESGDNITFYISANSGYEIENVVVDGVSKGAVSSVTVNNVTEDIAVTATFKVSSGGTTPTPTGKPVDANGALSVSGRFLVNEHGDPIQLRGMSTHGIQYFQDMFQGAKADSVAKALANNWEADVLRISSYVNEGSGYNYTSNPSFWHSYIDNLVDAATKYGIYVIIDWHMLSPGNPNDAVYNQSGSSAEEFWAYMADKHGTKKNVIFEICNEPNGTSWSQIKSYADRIIPVIRTNDPDNATNPNVVIVGTPDWASSPNDVINSRVNDANVMYTMHFYAADHQVNGSYTYWDKLKVAIDADVPVFVTEFGTQDAAGEGENDFDNSQLWLDSLAKYKISWVNWNLSDDWRSGAVFTSRNALYDCADYADSSNLKEAGQWILDKIKHPADDWGNGGATYSETSNMINWASWNANKDEFGSTIDTGSALVSGGAAKTSFSLVPVDAANSEFSWGAMYASLPEGANNNLDQVVKVQVTYRSNSDWKLSLPMTIDESGEAYFAELPASPTYTTQVINISRFVQPSWAGDANLTHPLELSDVTSLVFGLDGAGIPVDGYIEIDSLTLFNYQGEEAGIVTEVTEIHKTGITSTFTTVDSAVLANSDTLVTTTNWNEIADTLINKIDTVDNGSVIGTSYDTVSVTLDSVEISSETETLPYIPTVTTETTTATVRGIIDTVVAIDTTIEADLDTVITTDSTERFEDTLFTIVTTFHDGAEVLVDSSVTAVTPGDRLISSNTITIPHEVVVTTETTEETIRAILDTITTVDSVVQANLDTVVTTAEVERYEDSIFTVVTTYHDRVEYSVDSTLSEILPGTRTLNTASETLPYIEVTTTTERVSVIAIIDTVTDIDSVVQENLDTVVTTRIVEGIQDSLFDVETTFHNGVEVNVERALVRVIGGARILSTEVETLPYIHVTVETTEETVREIIDTVTTVNREVLENLDTVVTTVVTENFNDTLFEVVTTYRNGVAVNAERTMKSVSLDSREISSTSETISYQPTIVKDTTDETVRAVIDTVTEADSTVNDDRDTIVVTTIIEQYEDSLFSVVTTYSDDEVVDVERTIVSVTAGTNELDANSVVLPYIPSTVIEIDTVYETEVTDTVTTIDTTYDFNGQADTLVETIVTEEYTLYTIEVTDTLKDQVIVATERDTLNISEEERVLSETADTLSAATAIIEIDHKGRSGIESLTFAPNPVLADDEGTMFIVPSEFDGEWYIGIYDVVGNLIDEATITSFGGATYMWDLNNRYGQPVANGTYVAIISYEDRNGRKRQFKTSIGVRE